jgi:hypothetical protein
MATIVAAVELNAANQFTFAVNDTVEPPGPQTSYFVHVPPGTATFDVALETKAQNLTLGFKDPLGREDWGAHTFRNPIPGVWEIGVTQGYRGGGLDILWQFGDTLAPKVGYRVTAKAYAATIEEDRTIAAVIPPDGMNLKVWNVGAPFSGEVATTALAHGSERSERIMPDEQKVYDLDVPDGTRMLGVLLQAREADGADLDVYLFDCSGRECTTASTDVGPGSSATLWRDRPAKGRWRVVVDGARVPPGGMEFKLTDVIAQPALGSLVTADPPKSRVTGDGWMVKAHSWRPVELPAGRIPFVILQAVSGDGDGQIRIARHAVRIGNVSR